MGGSFPTVPLMQEPLSSTLSTSSASNPGTLPRWMRYSALRRLAVALLAALLVCVLVEGRVSAEVQILLTWNTGAWIYVLWSVALVSRTDAQMTRLHARSQAHGGRALFAILLSAALVSVLALGFLVQSVGDLPFWAKLWHVGLSVTALLGAWSLVHLLFAFHYARLYYTAPLREDQALHEGLDFPGDKLPEYFDFMYFAFAVGMSSTAPDVGTTSRQMRKTTLMHGVLAFAFNILILSLSVNILAAVV